MNLSVLVAQALELDPHHVPQDAMDPLPEVWAVEAQVVLELDPIRDPQVPKVQNEAVLFLRNHDQDLLRLLFWVRLDYNSRLWLG